MELLDPDCFNDNCLPDTGTPEKNTPLLDKVDYGEKFYTLHASNISSYDSNFTEVSTISNLNLNIFSSSDFTLVDSTIASQHTAEK